MNKKLGMSNFQIGVLLFLGILTCGIVGGIGFWLFNGAEKTQDFNFSFSDPQKEIIGKWEVVSEESTGTIYEFFPDGTLSTGAFASKYSFPDQTHIKIDTGNLSVIMEYTISNNELVLINKNPIIRIDNSKEPYILKLRRIE